LRRNERAPLQSQPQPSQWTPATPVSEISFDM
jgi:hypothetical protein